MRILLSFLFLCLAADAREWRFTVPPSALHRVEVNDDWRRHGKLELDVRVKGELPKGEVFCSFFIETKYNWWFESRRKLTLKKRRNRFVLDLSETSPDWEAPDVYRPFGPDVLRWVRNWGVKVFSAEEQTITLDVSGLRFAPSSVDGFKITKVTLPDFRVGAICPIRFRTAGFTGNPYDAGSIRTWLLVNGKIKVPGYFVQGFAPFRLPGHGQAKLVPLDLPGWQVNWTPQRSGPYELELVVEHAGRLIRRRIGTVEVQLGAKDATADSGKKQFVHDYKGPPLYQRIEGDWGYPDSGLLLDQYLRAQLDWTARWGTYTGLGEFDQEIAWELDRSINALDPDASLPIVVFSEDELDNQGTYNWKDHPLNKRNHGELPRPTEFFRDATARRVILNRARYIWSRYGARSKVSGLLFLVNRPQEDAVRWLNEISATLREEFPDIRIFSDNPGLPRRSRIVKLKLFDSWQTDQRLAKFTFIDKRPRQQQVVVEGRYPDPTAIVHNQTTQHWHGAEVFAVDIRNSETAGDQVKVMCFIRTDPATCYQTELFWLREDDWNRVYFPLNKPEAWTCVTHPGRKLKPWELLNLREVALRFFCDEPNEVVLSVRNAHLLYPTLAEMKRRGPMSLTARQEPPKEMKRFSKFEFDFDLDRRFRNPYDAEEIDVQIRFKVGDDPWRTHPAYFHEPWKLEMVDGREVPVRDGDPFWRVRFTPNQVGEYRWELVAKTRDESVSYTGDFRCIPNDAKGFVRISPDNPRFFEFEDGSFYYPIGHNLRSPSDRRPNIYKSKTMQNVEKADRLGTRMYEQWFAKMRENGENFTRIWMCPWWTGLEWNRKAPGFHGIGYYNQQNGARLDRIMDLAEKNDIYINLETANHGIFSTDIDREWDDNPYSKTVPGGFLQFATDFFTNDKAQRLHEQKLRYTIARWGYSPSVAIWGIITETEWVEAYFRGLPFASSKKLPKVSWVPRPYKTKAHQDSVRRWLVQTGDYIRRTDAHPHIVTTHFSNPQNGNEMWKRDNIDVIHNNAYTWFANFWEKQEFRRSRGVADVMHVYDKFFSRFAEKPILIGEWGGHPRSNRESHLRAELHTGIWSNFMVNTAGITGYWWWNLLDAYDMYDRFKAVSRFAAGEDRRGKDYRCERAIIRFTRGNRNDRHGLVLVGRNQMFAYIYSSAINSPNRSRVANSFHDSSFPVSGKGDLVAPRLLQPGHYEIEFWNTFTGDIISTAEVTITAKQRRIPILSHRVDVALKVKPLQPASSGTRRQ